MYPAKFDILAYQSSTLDLPIWYRAAGVLVNLAGYSALMQVRASVAAEEVILELSDADGTILLGADVVSTVTNDDELPNIQLLLPSADMLAVPAGEYVYDLTLTDGDGKVTTILYRGFTVTAGVTRPGVTP